ncbi:MAG: anaerobic ribonucleoside triphosphate reductase [Clostridia bacterium]|nr:anaerobic ribonucleoside triphosphate reductase [Clostridia bacterium]
MGEIKKIVKRDGRKQKFDQEKIVEAIFKAAQSVGGDDRKLAEQLAEKVVNYLNEKYEGKEPTVENVQDAVEYILIEEGHAQTAKSYIIYRNERTTQREMGGNLMKTLYDITFQDANDNDVKRENANVNADTAMGTMLKYGSESAKKFYQLLVLKPEHAKAHAEGDIHIHDLDFYALTTTCCQIDLIKLFKDGFCTGEGFLREPNSISSYAALACIAIQSNQNDQHGGQSIPNFEYAMAEGVKKSYAKLYRKNLIKGLEVLADKDDCEDEVREMMAKIKEEKNLEPVLEGYNDYQKEELPLLEKMVGKDIVVKAQKFAIKNAEKEIDRETYQAMEALIHNLNTMHSRAGAQVPFSSINYGLDTTPEGRLVMINLLLATEAGLGNGETPIFPIQILKIKDGINYNKGDKNYDIFKLACRVSAKRLFPNFSFIDAPFNLPYYKPGDYNTEIAYMGCRTRVMANVYDPTREIVTGRGNLSFTSINLPRLGIEAKGDIPKFYEMLDKKIDLVIDQLLERLKVQGKRRVKNSPFLMGQGVWIDSDKLDPEDELAEVLKHGTLTIGFIGLAETLVALTGKHHGEDEAARKLGLEIIGHMRQRMDDAAKQYKLNFSIIATPAEGLSGRFVRMDKKKYGIIKGVTDRDYYTNSFHVPVYYKISAFDKIKIEAPYHNLTNGGHISYIELDGDPTKNLTAFEKIVRCMKEEGIGYGAINHPVDRDPVCGYTGILKDTCPNCGRKDGDDGIKFERIRRITGYLVGTVDRFNNAKRAEVKDRVKHKDMSKNDDDDFYKFAPKFVECCDCEKEENNKK